MNFSKSLSQATWIRFAMLRCAALGLLAGGCVSPGRTPGPAESGEPEPKRVVIERINRNTQAMDFLLKGVGVTAIGDYRNSNGELVPFEMNGTLYFRKPRNLCLSLGGLAGRMIAGSNAEEFWVWKQFDQRQYWWGRHDQMAGVAEADIPIRPDHLTEVLGFVDLPTDTSGPLGPVYWVGSRFYEFGFLERDSAGQLYYVKAIDVDRDYPYLVSSIVYFHPDGRPLVLARLSNYQEVSGTEVLAPHRIELEWLQAGNSLELQITRFERSDNARVEPEMIDQSPLKAGRGDLGHITRVDRPALQPRILPATVPATQQAEGGRP